MLGKVDRKQDLSNFMHDLSRSYTTYFNEKYEKVGYLWQGRFKSKVIATDRYLLDCINYIELNPVRADIATTPYGYRWSSHMERSIGISGEKQLLNTMEI